MNAKKTIVSLLVIGFLVTVGSASAKFATPDPAVFEESKTRSIEGLTPIYVSTFHAWDDNLYPGLLAADHNQDSKYVFDSNDTRIYVAVKGDSSWAVYNAGVEKGLFTSVGEVNATHYYSPNTYGFKAKNPGTLVGTVSPAGGEDPFKIAVEII